MRLLAILAAFAILAAGPALAEHRFALVVGNDAYEEVPTLRKAVNDARAVGQALERLGFAVDIVENGSRNALSRGLVAFERKLGPGDTALFFFAGHGFEIRGDNYLLPTDVPNAFEGEDGLVRDASFAAKDIIDRIQATGASTVIAILDACRNNPFEAAGARAIGGNTRGLARMDPADGVFILFSAGAKQEALDNLGSGDPEPNSVFTRVLVKTVERPGLSLVEIAKETQGRVRAIAETVNHQQTPAYYDQVIGDFYLRPLGEGEKPAEVADRSALLDDVAVWKGISASADATVLRDYLSRYGETALFADEAHRRLASLAPPEVTAAEKRTAVDTCVAQTAKALDPSYGDLPRILDEDLDWAAAEEACARARALAPDDGKVAFGLGRVLDHDPARRAEALRLLEEAANRGSPAAANYAASVYYLGDGVPVDYARARLYYQLADKGGYYGSVVRYAEMMENGVGGRADPALALGVLGTAAEAGIPEAAFDLGVRYDQAVGVKRDPAEARKWYELAVKGGLNFAAFTLAALVGHGQGGPVDRARAADLVIAAFAGDHPENSNDMREMLKKFDRRVLTELEKKLAAEGGNPGKVDGRLDDQSFAALDAVAARHRAAPAN